MKKVSPIKQCSMVYVKRENETLCDRNSRVALQADVLSVPTPLAT